jgi:hypothetical protein
VRFGVVYTAASNVGWADGGDFHGICDGAAAVRAGCAFGRTDPPVYSTKPVAIDQDSVVVKWNLP